MAILTLTFPPGTCAGISKSGSTWTVNSVNTTAVTITIDDTDNNGTISGAEWDAAVGGDGNDIGGANYLYEGSGTSGQLYSTDGTTTFTVGQNVSSVRKGLANTFEADVSGVVCLTKGTKILTADGWRSIETISVDDKVVVDTGRIETVRWIGRRCFGQNALHNDSKLRPVRISAGAALLSSHSAVARSHRVHQIT